MPHAPRREAPASARRSSRFASPACRAPDGGRGRRPPRSASLSSRLSRFRLHRTTLLTSRLHSRAASQLGGYMDIKKVGVVGCGLMGHGIAQVVRPGRLRRRRARGRREEARQAVSARSRSSSARAVEKGKMEQSQADEVMGRIKGTLDYEDFADCDLVIEAITEDLDDEARDVEGARPDRQATRRSSPPTPRRSRSSTRRRRRSGPSASSASTSSTPPR